jgi:hypothetical protein
MNKWTANETLMVAGVAVLAGYFVIDSLGDAVKSVGNAVNPVNHDNIFNRAFESIYDGGSDGEGSLGTDLYDFFNPPPEPGE